jgi:hypothetical protein
MFEEIKIRPCIIEWIGDSHILFNGCGFLPIVVTDSEVWPLKVHTSYEAAKTELLQWLEDLEDCLKYEQICKQLLGESS